MSSTRSVSQRTPATKPAGRLLRGILDLHELDQRIASANTNVVEREARQARVYGQPLGNLQIGGDREPELADIVVHGRLEVAADDCDIERPVREDESGLAHR